MKYLILATICSMLAVPAFSAPERPARPQSAKRVSMKDMTPEQRAKLREARLRQHGGLISIKGKGHLAVLSAQKDFGHSDITNSVDQLQRFVRGVRVEFSAIDAFSIKSAKQAREKAGAGACIFLIDDPELPMSLIAIEESWGAVNIASLRDGNPSKEKFLFRFQKEFIRVSSIVFSGVKSQYKTSPLQSVRSISDLDRTIGDNYGIDTLMAIANHLPDLGVECDKQITYRQACQRGIAPQPTNEYQKAVWDAVHAIPQKPMKIEFDAKKGR